ncbi:flagellar basal body P-ring formation protein FlgA [Candidatus Poribacteria bacterium]|nr:flagellar basal body P-ring formation protein FlgA [Candidatus Poribacteria bacterium]
MRHKIYIIFSGLLMLLILTASALENKPENQISINISEKVLVEGKNIYLGNIADFNSPDEKYKSSLKEIIIGNAPRPGFSQTFHISYIKSRMQHQGIDIDNISWEGPQQVIVESKAFYLTEKDFQSRAENFIKTLRVDLKDSRINLRPFNDIRPSVLPYGDVSVNTELVSEPSPNGTISVRFVISVDDEECEKRVILFKLEAYREVLVAANTIDRQSIIQKDDLKKALRNVSGKFSFYTEISELTGKRTRLNINNGKIITADMVEEPPIVKRGDLVTIMIKGPGFTITAQGQANENAPRLGTIRVINTASRKELTAKVINSELVKVQYIHKGQ